MSVTINGTSGVTTPGIANSEGYTGDGLTIAAGAPAGAVAINSTYQTFSPNGSEAMRLDASGNLLFNSGYGSVAKAYGCRAWVNFNGTGTVAIRASGNVSSITDNGTGSYTVNFTTAMPDANYAPSVQNSGDATIGTFCMLFANPTVVVPQTTAFGFVTVKRTDGEPRDANYLCVSVFR